MESLNTYWPDILGVVRQKVPQQTFDTWFLPLQPMTSNNGAYQVGCPNHFFLDWFTEHHLGTLNDAGSSFFGNAVIFRLEVNRAITDSEDDIFRPDTTTEETETPVAKTRVAAQLVTDRTAAGIFQFNLNTPRNHISCYIKTNYKNQTKQTLKLSTTLKFCW